MSVLCTIGKGGYIPSQDGEVTGTMGFSVPNEAWFQHLSGSWLMQLQLPLQSPLLTASGSVHYGQAFLLPAFAKTENVQVFIRVNNTSRGLVLSKARFTSMQVRLSPICCCIMSFLMHIFIVDCLFLGCASVARSSLLSCRNTPKMHIHAFFDSIGIKKSKNVPCKKKKNLCTFPKTHWWKLHTCQRDQ